MNFLPHSNPLSSLALRGRSAAPFSTPPPPAPVAWRSEAFAEDLLGEGPPAAPARGAQGRAALLCAVPLTVAALAGWVAWLQMRA